MMATRAMTTATTRRMAAILVALFARLLEDLRDALGILRVEVAELDADVEAAVAQFVLVDHEAAGGDHAPIDGDEELEVRADAHPIGTDNRATADRDGLGLRELLHLVAEA